ncbi:hypothetical protein HDU76_012603 [Blyttiomyces sp. JEL0837]|nr:hypothetical protein HDU76_012603 [Blyttiomyces sp. JEL0837]
MIHFQNYLAPIAFLCVFGAVQFQERVKAAPIPIRDVNSNDITKREITTPDGWTYVGCFGDIQNTQDHVVNNALSLGTPITVEECLQQAFDNDYVFAALINATDCFGGMQVNVTIENEPVSDQYCNLPCLKQNDTSGVNETCGGTQYEAVYQQISTLIDFFPDQTGVTRSPYASTVKHTKHTRKSHTNMKTVDYKSRSKSETDHVDGTTKIKTDHVDVTTKIKTYHVDGTTKIKTQTNSPTTKSNHDLTKIKTGTKKPKDTDAKTSYQTKSYIDKKTKPTISRSTKTGQHVYTKVTSTSKSS